MATDSERRSCSGSPSGDCDPLDDLRHPRPRGVIAAAMHRRGNSKQCFRVVQHPARSSNLEPGSKDGPPHTIGYLECPECGHGKQIGGGRTFDVDDHVIERARCDASPRRSDRVASRARRELGDSAHARAGAGALRWGVRTARMSRVAIPRDPSRPSTGAGRAPRDVSSRRGSSRATEDHRTRSLRSDVRVDVSADEAGAVAARARDDCR